MPSPAKESFGTRARWVVLVHVDLPDPVAVAKSRIMGLDVARNS